MIGVLALLPLNPARIALPEQQRLLETFVSQIALALERVRLAAEAQRAQMKMETEQLRNTLLSAISHDLRTPLAAIVGASSSLLRDSDKLDAHARQELGQSIYEEAIRMAGLANNLLDMARLEAGAVVLNRQWQPLEEVVGGALAGMNSRMANHPVSVRLPRDLPLVEIDSLMIERVFCQPAGKRREIHAIRHHDRDICRNRPESVAGDRFRSRSRNSGGGRRAHL